MSIKKGRHAWQFLKAMKDRAFLTTKNIIHADLIARLLPLFFIVLMGSGVNMGTGVSAAENFRHQIVPTPDDLPAGVKRTMLALARAAQSKDIENMREVLHMNELMPLINGQFIHDPVAHWKNASKNGTGRDILAIFSQLLSGPTAQKSDPKRRPLCLALVCRCPSQQADIEGNRPNLPYEKKITRLYRHQKA